MKQNSRISRRVLSWLAPLLTSFHSTQHGGKSSTVLFRCNICGCNSENSLVATRGREIASCRTCGSTLRFRAIVNGLSIGLFNQQIALPDFPLRREIKGIGLSDSQLYAERLARKFSYKNTFFHAPPQLDIADVEGAPFAELDFLIASDVFEHVRPPVADAFRNARRLLRRGGVFVFSVPYVPGSTKEHFPNLHEYFIERRQDHFVLSNRTVDGQLEQFESLVFHGGPGTTLEMRLFGFDDLVRHFKEAAFDPPTLLSHAAPQFGIDFTNEVCSIPMVARAR